MFEPNRCGDSEHSIQSKSRYREQEAENRRHEHKHTRGRGERERSAQKVGCASADSARAFSRTREFIFRLSLGICAVPSVKTRVFWCETAVKDELPPTNTRKVTRLWHRLARVRVKCLLKRYHGQPLLLQVESTLLFRLIELYPIKN